MEATETRQVFSRLVQDEPPLPDVGPLVAAAHAAGRRRRWASTGGGALAVVAVVASATALPMLLPGHESPATEVQSRGQTVKALRPAALPDQVPTYPTTTEPPAAAAARLTAALRSVVNLPPAARLVRVKSFWGGPGKPNALEFVESQGGFKAMADIADPAGTSNLFLDISDASGVPMSGNPCGAPSADTVCRSDRTPDGDWVTVSRQAQGGIVRLSASAVRMDGTSNYLSCQNYGENSVPQVKNPPDPQPGRPSPICTEDQLVSIALAPTLSFYPPGWTPLAQQPTHPVSPARVGACPPGAEAKCAVGLSARPQ